MLRLKGIKKDYVLADQTVPALKGVSLDFRKNEFVAILGPSGCGKTTLLNIIGGLDRYTDGDLVIDGVSTKKFKDADWDNYRNKKIGFVFQNYNLIPHLNVLENVEMAMTLSGVSKQERKNRALEALERVGLKGHENKKPNQLSGGQMQRVAIARALVNKPDILLADEPTGALDTKTSIQILDLIREISKDKLVIMVTHNAELAKDYADRIIKVRDGEVLEDSRPFEAQEKAPAETGKKKDKLSMSFFTALSLSLKNLFTKKARTILTAIAGSIGIIGIALVLAISNGMNLYISKLQADTLSSNPITVSKTSFDMNKIMDMVDKSEDLQKFPKKDEILIKMESDMSDFAKRNNITEAYVTYVKENLNSEWYYDVIYDTGLDLSFYGKTYASESYRKLNLKGASSGMPAMMTGGSWKWQVLVENDFLATQYDVLKGKLPQNKNEIVAVVDEYNRLPEGFLKEIGLLPSTGSTDAEIIFDFDDVLGLEFKYATNDELYQFDGTKFVNRDIDFDAAETLKIVGIVRLNEQTQMGVLSASGIGYTKALVEDVQQKNKNSALVQWMEANPTANPRTGADYVSSGFNTKEEQRANDYRKFGGNLVPAEISVYAKDFESKDAIKKVLDDFNVTQTDPNAKVYYMDMSETLGMFMSTLVNIVSYVLIGFTAISLVVSCVMIGIITYVSVIERTKEIGILRSIGARKKDISRVFNAETFLIGLVAGVFGVLVALLLCVPINLIVNALAEVSTIAVLSLPSGILLILISVFLTFLSGFIPARIAAKKDPVLALRTE